MYIICGNVTPFKLPCVWFRVLQRELLVELHYPRLASRKINSDCLSFIVNATLHSPNHLAVKSNFPLPHLPKVWRSVMTKKAIWTSAYRLKNDTEICPKNTRCGYLEQIQLAWIRLYIESQITDYVCSRVIPPTLPETWHKKKKCQPQNTNRKLILSLRSRLVAQFTLTSDDLFLNLKTLLTGLWVASVANDNLCIFLAPRII
jgi:hypothetical protein